LRMQETVPDSVFDERADEVVMIDTAHLLLDRLPGGQG